jgi:hypothetical protein
MASCISNPFCLSQVVHLERQVAGLSEQLDGERNELLHVMENAEKQIATADSRASKAESQVPTHTTDFFCHR